jgi:hypothetical protein
MGLAVGLAALCGVVGGVGVSLLMATVVRSFGPTELVAPALAGGLIGAVCGLAVRGRQRWGPWPSVVGVAATVGLVVVPEVFSGRQNWQVGTVVWAVALVPVLCVVAALVRRGARLAAAVTAVVGGLLAVYAGVAVGLAWLVHELQTVHQALIWLWFLYAFDGGRHPFPHTLDLADEVGFAPHAMIAATAFAVCLVVVTAAWSRSSAWRA